MQAEKNIYIVYVLVLFYSFMFQGDNPNSNYVKGLSKHFTTMVSGAN